MNTEQLENIAKQMVAKGKGILAADESIKSAGKRLEAVGIENTEENRRLYRELFLEMPGVEQYLSGVILHDETFWQKNNAGVPYPGSLASRGIFPGIKVDEGTVEMPGFPGESYTEGLDGLRERVKKYVEHGAKFAKWREVISIGEHLPSPEVVHTAAETLGLYARICQEEGLVPMVEPEVLLTGNHSLVDSERVTTETVKEVFKELAEHKVHIPGVILKTSMVIPGSESGEAQDPEQIAEATVRMLKAAVPENAGGVVFLSGGQTPDQATANLAAIAKREPLPWEIAFSYARALQSEALEVWRGKPENFEAAREVFLNRLKLDVLADRGAVIS